MPRYIIDSHAHIFPIKIAKKASDNIGGFYNLPMRFDGSVDSLLEIGKKNGIDKFVVQSVATVPEQVSHINDFIAQQVSEWPDKFIGFASLHPDMENPEEELERVIAKGLKGVKLHPDFQRFAIDEKKARRLYEIIGDRLPILIHTGDKRFSYSNPVRLAKILDDFPKLRVIAAHFGGWSEWEQAEEYLCGKNVWIDTSSSLYEISPEKAASLIGKFGYDRVFFGTDYPMWDAKEELSYIEKIPITEEQREAVLWKNIADFLDIKMD